MLRTAVPTFASSRAWRGAVRAATGCCTGGTKALAATTSKYKLANRIAKAYVRRPGLPKALNNVLAR